MLHAWGRNPSWLQAAIRETDMASVNSSVIQSSCPFTPYPRLRIASFLRATQGQCAWRCSNHKLCMREWRA
eukprot:3206081-Rhodomonas_salina.1